MVPLVPIPLTQHPNQFKSIHINEILPLQGDVSSDYSPNKLPHSKTKSISPSVDRRSFSQQRSTASTGKLAKYQMPRYPEETASRRSASLKQTQQRTSMPYVDHLTGDKKLDNLLYGN